MATIGMYTADYRDLTNMGAAATFTLSNEQARTGTYSFKMTTNGTGATIPLGGNYGTIYFRAACYITSFGTSTTEFQFKDGSNVQTSIRLVNGYIDCYRQNTINLIGGAAAYHVTTNQWFVLESKIIIHDTTGSVVAKINGDTVLNLTNVDTKYTANAYVNSFALYSFGPTMYLDDIVFDDANWPGLGGIEVLFPDAAGAATAWTGTYADVDENPPDDDTTYISTNAAVTGTEETFTFPDCNANTTTVSRVGLVAKAKLDGAGSGSLSPMLNSNKPTGTGLSTSYARVHRFWDTDPSDSNPWSEAKVNTIDAGVSS